MAEVSVLPSAMQARMEALKEAEDAGAVDPPQPPATPPADDGAATPPASTEGHVTVSREEYNDLRAAADSARGVASRLEESEVRNAALEKRLTELEASHKGNPDPALPPAPAAPASPTLSANVEFSPDEEERYGESREYIEKVATAVAVKLLNPVLERLDRSISEAQNTAGNVATSFEQARQNEFNAALSAQAPNYKELIRHKNWNAFLDETDELSGFTMAQLLATHISQKNATQAGKIYKRFESKYVKPASDNGAYAGAMPGSTAANPPVDPNASKVKLKLSDRTKANKDFTHGKISWEELQKVNKAFEEAEKAGNVDYNS